MSTNIEWKIYVYVYVYVYVYMLTHLFNSFIGLTCLLAGTETIAMTMLTKYSKNTNRTHFLILGVIIYGLLIPYLLIKSISFEGIGSVNLAWNIITTVTMIIIGYYIFGDRVNHLHIISLAFGILSIILLYIANQQ